MVGRVPDAPVARQDGLLVEEVEDELVVYDQRRDSAHRLNRTAAIVWRHCDGKHDTAQLLQVLEAEVGKDLADEDLVEISLDMLADKGLLEDAAPARAPEETRLSRRRFIRRVGTVGAAALVLPSVTSLVAPTAAHAQTQCTTCTACTSSCTSCATCTSCVCTSCTACG
jgi:hypothetical protein